MSNKKGGCKMARLHIWQDDDGDNCLEWVWTGWLTRPVMVEYKGKHWFSPIARFSNAKAKDFVRDIQPDSVTVEFSIESEGVDVIWPNFWARPVHWLWRHWNKLKVLVHKYLGFGTERRHHGNR